MNQEISNILNELNFYKNDKNKIIAAKAEKLKKFIIAFQNNEITAKELDRLLKMEITIDKMQKLSDEMEMVQKIDKMAGLARKVLGF